MVGSRGVQMLSLSATGTPNSGASGCRLRVQPGGAGQRTLLVHVEERVERAVVPGDAIERVAAHLDRGDLARGDGGADFASRSRAGS